MATLRLVLIVMLVPCLSVAVSRASASVSAEPCVNYTGTTPNAKIGACKVANKVLRLIIGGETWTPDTYVEARCLPHPSRRKLYCKITPASRGAAEDWEGTCWIVTYTGRLPNKLTGVVITRWPRGSW